jgi:hypothetical protein
MRNFFKNHFPRKNKIRVGSINKRQYLESDSVPELIDSDEDRVIKQYDRYRNYISDFGHKIMKRGAKLMGYNDQLSSSQ